jgi:hypothetical protein
MFPMTCDSSGDDDDDEVDDVIGMSPQLPMMAMMMFSPSKLLKLQDLPGLACDALPDQVS